MPEHTSKTFSGPVEWKASTGSFEAVFSTFGIMDADGEVVTHEALAPWEGKDVPIVWGHDWRSLDAQVGKGTIAVDAHQARIQGQFNLRTPSGQAAYETVKFNGALQQYSWGFSVTKSDIRPLATEPNGAGVPHITGVIPYEVSPVLVGSNPVTGTLAIRSQSTPSADEIAQAVVAALRETPDTTDAESVVTDEQESDAAEKAIALARARLDIEAGALALKGR